MASTGTGTRSQRRRRSKVWAMAALTAVLALVATACGGAEPDVVAPDAPAEQETPAADEPPTADEEEVVLTAVSAFPRDTLAQRGFWLFVDKLEEVAPWITIDYRGGPDAIDSFEQGEAVASGAVDMSVLPESYYAQELPYVHGLKFTPFTPSEERENGVYEQVNSVHEEEMGVHYLGRVTHEMPFQLFLNEHIDEADLSGLTIRVSPIYVPLVEALGGAVVSMPGGEIYTAMDRGVVDGFGWASIGVTDFGLHEVTRYELFPEFYENFVVVIINLDSWQSLSEGTQAALREAMIETEREVGDLFAAILDEERAERLAPEYMERLDLPPDEADRFLETAYEAGWQSALDEDARVQELRDLFGN